MQSTFSTPGQFGARAAALVLCLAATGCASVKPTVPPDIAASGTALEVRSAGRMYQLFNDGYFQVGAYQISGIHHDFAAENELSIGQYSQASATSSFRFAIAGPRSTSTALCDRQFHSRYIGLSRMDAASSRSRLHCELGSGELKATFELLDDAAGLHGAVQIDGVSYNIRQYADGNPNPRAYIPVAAGVRIDRGGRNLAALAFEYPGTFWLNRSLPPEQQDAFAGVLAAMLISVRH